MKPTVEKLKISPQVTKNSRIFLMDKSQKEHVVEPEPEYISFHEFLAFIFQNVCSLPSTPRTEAFLDSLINLSASILNRRRNFNSLEVLKPHAESIYHLKSYKMLLDSIMNLEATSRTCTQCKEVLTSLVDLRTHMILFHLGSDNWKLLQPGVAKELRCAPCSQQFYSVFVYFLHLNLCIGKVRHRLCFFKHLRYGFNDLKTFSCLEGGGVINELLVLASTELNFYTILPTNSFLF